MIISIFIALIIFWIIKGLVWPMLTDLAKAQAYEEAEKWLKESRKEEAAYKKKHNIKW